MEHITSKIIEREIGLKGNTLHYYIAAGAIIPFDPGGGRGTQRRFSKKNLLEAVMLKNFIGIGFSKVLILKIFRKINEDTKWKKLNPVDALKKFVAFELNLLGDEVKCELIQQDWPGKAPRSFDEVEMDDFVNTLTGKATFEITLDINQRCQLLSLVNLSAIATQYLRIFDQ